MVVQGADDQYGTLRQVEIAQEECYCPVHLKIISGAGHCPHREATGVTLEAIEQFAKAALRDDRGLQAA